MSRSVVALRQMLSYSREARALASKSSRQKLEENRLLNLALTRLLEIIGEAASRAPAQEQSRLPGVSWSQITGMRNRLIHGYDLVDFDILWQTATEDLPPLIGELERILASEG